MRKRFSGDDLEQWLSTAGKFTVWLDSEKAYYAAARPYVSCSYFCFLTMCTDNVQLDSRIA